jgi:hypothetical protein
MYTCAGTKPDGTPCARSIREEHGYCFMHDPIRGMMRNGKHSPITDAEQLVLAANTEREHGTEALLGEGEGSR